MGIQLLSFQCPGDCKACEALNDGRIKDPVFCLSYQMSKQLSSFENVVDEKINSLQKTINTLESMISSLQESIDVLGSVISNSSDGEKVIAIQDDNTDSLFPEDKNLKLDFDGKDK